MKKITLEDIKKARDAIKEHVDNTALEFSRSCSDELGTDVYLKCENRQFTGSFKIRGAYNKISSLSDEEKARGVIAVSAGNHAQGVALSASKLGVDSTIIMPMTSSLVKAEATRNYGAQVILHGEVFDETMAYGQNLQKERNLVLVHPYNDPKVMAGQGTIGLEILEQLPEIDSIVMSIGGGGLFSGVATAIKALKPEVKIYGVVTQAFPGMLELFENKDMTPLNNPVTIADGIAVKKPSIEIFENYIKPNAEGITAVDDDAIAASVVFLLERTKYMVEGSGAAVLAGAKQAGWDLGKKCVLLLSGGNIDLNVISKTIERGLVKSGRLARFSVLVHDKPGVLNQITNVTAQVGANILEVHHDRLDMTLSFKEARIQFLIETKSDDQIREIEKEISKFASKVEIFRF